MKVPFYLNNRNQTICQECEKDYEGEELLAKVSNQRQLKGLIAATVIPVYWKDLSAEERYVEGEE